MPSMTAAQRQRRFRAAQISKGLQQLTVWLHVTDSERLQELLTHQGYTDGTGNKQHGMTEVLGQALQCLEKQTNSQSEIVGS